MRRISCFAALALVSGLAAPAFADPPGDLVVSGATISVKNPGAFHLNGTGEQPCPPGPKRSQRHPNGPAHNPPDAPLTHWCTPWPG